MKITFIVQQNFDIDAASLGQARHWLREGLFPTEETLLAVIDERGHDITEEWRKMDDQPILAENSMTTAENPFVPLPAR
jgi:hypothetical protein